MNKIRPVHIYKQTWEHNVKCACYFINRHHIICFYRYQCTFMSVCILQSKKVKCNLWGELQTVVLWKRCIETEPFAVLFHCRTNAYIKKKKMLSWRSEMTGELQPNQLITYRQGGVKSTLLILAEKDISQPEKANILSIIVLFIHSVLWLVPNDVITFFPLCSLFWLCANLAKISSIRQQK